MAPRRNKKANKPKGGGGPSRAADNISFDEFSAQVDAAASGGKKRKLSHANRDSNAASAQSEQPTSQPTNEQQSPQGQPFQLPQPRLSVVNNGNTVPSSGASSGPPVTEMRGSREDMAAMAESIHQMNNPSEFPPEQLWETPRATPQYLHAGNPSNGPQMTTVRSEDGRIIGFVNPERELMIIEESNDKFNFPHGIPRPARPDETLSYGEGLEWERKRAGETQVHDGVPAAASVVASGSSPPPPPPYSTQSLPLPQTTDLEELLLPPPAQAQPPPAPRPSAATPAPPINSTTKPANLITNFAAASEVLLNDLHHLLTAVRAGREDYPQDNGADTNATGLGITVGPVDEDDDDISPWSRAQRRRRRCSHENISADPPPSTGDNANSSDASSPILPPLPPIDYPQSHWRAHLPLNDARRRDGHAGGRACICADCAGKDSATAAIRGAHMERHGARTEWVDWCTLVDEAEWGCDVQWFEWVAAYTTRAEPPFVALDCELADLLVRGDEGDEDEDDAYDEEGSETTEEEDWAGGVAAPSTPASTCTLDGERVEDEDEDVETVKMGGRGGGDGSGGGEGIFSGPGAIEEWRSGGRVGVEQGEDEAPAGPSTTESSKGGPEQLAAKRKKNKKKKKRSATQELQATVEPKEVELKEVVVKKVEIQESQVPEANSAFKGNGASPSSGTAKTVPTGIGSTEIGSTEVQDNADEQLADKEAQKAQKRAKKQRRAERKQQHHRDLERRQQEEIQRQRDAAKRQQEKADRRKKEVQRQADEAQRQENEVRRQEEELQRQREELQRRQDELQRQMEEFERKKNEHHRQQQAEEKQLHDNHVNDKKTSSLSDERDGDIDVPPSEGQGPGDASEHPKEGPQHSVDVDVASPNYGQQKGLFNAGEDSGSPSEQGQSPDEKENHPEEEKLVIDMADSNDEQKSVQEPEPQQPENENGSDSDEDSENFRSYEELEDEIRAWREDMSYLGLTQAGSSTVAATASQLPATGKKEVTAAACEPQASGGEVVATEEHQATTKEEAIAGNESGPTTDNDLVNIEQPQATSGEVPVAAAEVSQASNHNASVEALSAPSHAVGSVNYEAPILGNSAGNAGSAVEASQHIVEEAIEDSEEEANDSSGERQDLVVDTTAVTDSQSCCDGQKESSGPSDAFIDPLIAHLLDRPVSPEFARRKGRSDSFFIYRPEHPKAVVYRNRAWSLSGKEWFFYRQTRDDE